MLSNAYLLAKFRFDTAENERNFAEILPKTDNYAPAQRDPPTFPRGGRRRRRAGLLRAGHPRAYARRGFLPNFELTPSYHGFKKPPCNLSALLSTNLWTLFFRK